MNSNQLDRLFQQLSSGRRCNCCGHPAECVHHFIGRANRFLRWDIFNAVPVCLDCHRKIHDGKLAPVLPASDLNWCDKHRHTILKDWLLEKGVSEAEFMAEREFEIRSNLL